MQKKQATTYEVQDKIVQALLDLKKESLTLKQAGSKKYDIVFFGSDHNIINTIELRHSLEKCFDLNMSHDELLAIIPDACNSLNMKYEELQTVSVNDESQKGTLFMITLT
ncbi:hypothetical protein BAMY_09720 [Bacillus amyloliquefaciens]|uniref:hypothetical protein n=1 Tax=Bacillus TaxID=1386 RepID=UPI000470D14E|nr:MULTISPECIES: hypothetical protein [Bacillus amyloliquefaciens group]COE23319.1 Uncharacterised protein [Streptococcus pneumoniae]APB82417.1 hypothetical protein BAMY_09720 [Bacillus amyloliquefaciens]MED2998556.1 hypothetical protein [Bacillus velezensis]UMU15125.1 hypothetical protein FOV14_09895 [Bacillus velezensis]UQB56166.1 hypothetical protein J6B42_09835 [Bacillus velezensis]